MTGDPAYLPSPKPLREQRVALFGGSGTIGRATLRALLAAGHEVTCVVRPSSQPGVDHPRLRHLTGNVAEPSLLKDALAGVGAIISCLASRSGAPQDAWAVDYGINSAVLKAAISADVPRFVLLSAICVQKPKLEFQKAKLAFEAELISSDVTYSIVRPTAFFKSLSGQLDRLRAGKPFLVFGDGKLTACKPISDDDLARFLIGCLSNPACDNRVLPVGGPGPAMTPEAQARALCEALAIAPSIRTVPLGLMNAIIAGLSFAGLVSPKARTKAELARIGRYYATESMLVWDEVAGRYDANATPEFGSERLQDFYAKLVTGEVVVERGEHAVF